CLSCSKAQQTLEMRPTCSNKGICTVIQHYFSHCSLDTGSLGSSLPMNGLFFLLAVIVLDYHVVDGAVYASWKPLLAC
ncbi:MAG: hypothetical protein MJE68_07685, partial [Proteobacteria bacterium]|nr:hypothetical protein [Pseudomonadota bacterium]